MRRSLFAYFKTLISGGPVYIRVSRNRLDLFDAASGRRFSTKPVLRIFDAKSRNGAVLESMADASAIVSKATIVVNGFDHPRTVLSDFHIAERTIKLSLAELFKGQILQPSPIVVIHPLEKTEGGLTMIERRAFRELCEGAGARDVYVWEGPEFSESQISSDGFLDNLSHMKA